jgi:hypothetical protein
MATPVTGPRDRTEDTTRRRDPGTVRAMRHIALLVVPLALALLGSSALADPGDGSVHGPFRRTTPRGSLERDTGGLIVGIPSGRAWGIESDLVPLDGPGAVTLVLAVDDPEISEAFVRIAYYARADARSRQLATRDSPYVRVGEDRRISVELVPPPEAIAYRVRVLGRLVAGAVLSRIDAIHVRPDPTPADRGRARPSLTRLEPDYW